MGKGWVVAALLAAPLAAGAAWGDMKEGGKDGDRGGYPMIERMAKKMDLTAAQVDQLKKLEEQHRAAMTPLWKQMKDQMEALKGLVDKKAADGELTTALAAAKQTRKAIQAENDRHMDAASAVLTPAQQAKAALWMARKAGKRWGKGKEWKEGKHEDGHEGGHEGMGKGDDHDDDD